MRSRNHQQTTDQTTPQLEIFLEPRLANVRFSLSELSVEVHAPLTAIDEEALRACGERGQRVLAALECADRRYHYEDLTIEVTAKEAKRVWGPSVDSLAMLDALSSSLPSFSPSHITDLGCGSGFLAVWLARRFQDAQIAALDICQEAVHCTARNLAIASVSHRASALTADYAVVRTIEDSELVVCNPPYIPLPRSLTAPQPCFASPTALTRLLMSLPHQLAPKAIAVIALSNLTMGDLQIRDAWEDLSRHLQLNPILHRRIPFKVHRVIDDREWCSFLVKHCGLHVQHHLPYRYWHDLTVYQINH